MRRSPALAGLLFAFAGLTAASTALSQPNRVFASARSGSDANSCDNVLTPCQTFQGAVNQVAAGGEVIALDSGGYGKIGIGKAVKIEAPPGIVAFVHPSSGPAISIFAGASDVVILRGLVLSVGSSDGIQVSTVGDLHVENCVIDGFANGVEFTATGKVYVVDTVVRNSSIGIDLHPNSGTVIAAIERCRFENDGDGLEAGAFGGTIVKASVKDSFATGQVNAGFRADAGTGATAELNIENCLSANNDTGIFSFTSVGTAIVRVSNTTVTDNSTIGVRATLSGQILTRGNNTVEGNGTNGTFTGTFTAK